ncbi:MAG: hypothetical protein ACM30G_15485 [Micromonosporaceae bacterium]
MKEWLRTLFGQLGTRCDYGPCRWCTGGWMNPEQAAAKQRYEDFWTSGRWRRFDVTLEQLDRGDWQ